MEKVRAARARFVSAARSRWDSKALAGRNRCGHAVSEGTWKARHEGGVPILAMLTFALAAALQAPTPAVPGSDSAPGSILFVAQCRYASGVRALLTHGFASGDYVLALHAGNAAGSWRITPQPDGGVALDSVTVGPPREGDERAAVQLYSWLVRRDFRAVPAARFAEEVAREDVDACPEPYPFGG